MFKADDGLSAIRSLEHLLKYEISSKELHQSAAILHSGQRHSMAKVPRSKVSLRLIKCLNF